MVLSAIKKKLGGAQGEAPDAPAKPEVSEDIPDELPPLMEDEHGADVPAEKAPEQPAQTAAPKEVPEELPDLDTAAAAMQNEAQKDGAAKTQPAQAPATPTTTPAGTQASAQTVSPAPQSPAEPTPANTQGKEMHDDELAATEAKLKALEEENKDLFADSPQLQDSQPGFFGTLNSFIKKSPDLQDELLNQDLLTRMKSYWTAKNSVPENSWSNEQRLLDELEGKMRSLQQMENSWHMQALALEHERKLLHQKELDIRQKGAELQKLMRAVRFYRRVSEQNAFALANGLRVYSIKDLFDAVSVIDDSTFRHHVHGNKNDFAQWIRHNYPDEPALDIIEHSKTRGSFLKALESVLSLKPGSSEPGAFHKRKREPLAHNHHFHTCDGHTITTLEALPETLRQMSDDAFHHHVNPHRNDFSTWVEHVFHNKNLAERLHLAETRQEMINVLDIYL